MKDAKKIIKFIDFAEGLKTELRHATKSDHQRESVADHTWRLTLIIMLVAPKLEIKIDLLQCLKIAIIHDIVEIEAKDIPLIEHVDNKKLSAKKDKSERLAIKNIRNKLGKSGKEIYDLWYEFENQESNEAKVVKALDKLEGELQFLSDPVRKFTASDQRLVDMILTNTTELCSIDPFLKHLDETTFAQRKKRTSI